MEGGAAADRGLDPDTATVPLHDLFANSKSDTCAGVFLARVEPLENDKHFVSILRVDADAVVLDREAPLAPHVLRRHMDAAHRRAMTNR